MMTWIPVTWIPVTWIPVPWIPVFRGLEPCRAGEAGLGHGDDLCGAVLESKRAEKRQAQGRIQLGSNAVERARFCTV